MRKNLPSNNFILHLSTTVALNVYPVVIVQGRRILSDGLDARKLELIKTSGTQTGRPINTYRHVGEL